MIDQLFGPEIAASAASAPDVSSEADAATASSGGWGILPLLIGGVGYLAAKYYVERLRGPKMTKLEKAFNTVLGALCEKLTEVEADNDRLREEAKKSAKDLSTLGTDLRKARIALALAEKAQHDASMTATTLNAKLAELEVQLDVARMKKHAKSKKQRTAKTPSVTGVTT